MYKNLAQYTVNVEAFVFGNPASISANFVSVPITSPSLWRAFSNLNLRNKARITTCHTDPPYHGAYHGNHFILWQVIYKDIYFLYGNVQSLSIPSSVTGEGGDSSRVFLGELISFQLQCHSVSCIRCQECTVLKVLEGKQRVSVL